MERQRLAAMVAVLATALWGLHVVLVLGRMLAVGYPYGPSPLLSLGPLVTALIPVGAAVLLWLGRPVLGAAVLATTAVMHLPLTVSTLLLFRQPVDDRMLGLSLLGLSTFGLLVVATALAVADTPRPSRRPAHPGVLAAIGLALTGVIWPVVSYQVPMETYDAMAWSRPLFATAGDPWVVGVEVLVVVAHAAVLLYAATVDRRVGAVVVLAAALPWLASHVGNATAASQQATMFYTPAGWASIVGQISLLVIAATWWQRARATRGQEAFASSST